mgnify:CR=1 FL=1
MTTFQYNLFDTTLQQKFDKYHKDNPHVLNALIKMTDDAIAKGHNHLGMDLLFNVLRWESMISTRGDEYKINNSYSSRYVRLIEELRPDLIGVFSKRELRA